MPRQTWSRTCRGLGPMVGPEHRSRGLPGPETPRPTRDHWPRGPQGSPGTTGPGDSKAHPGPPAGSLRGARCRGEAARRRCWLCPAGLCMLLRTGAACRDPTAASLTQELGLHFSPSFTSPGDPGECRALTAGPGRPCSDGRPRAAGQAPPSGTHGEPRDPDRKEEGRDSETARPGQPAGAECPGWDAEAVSGVVGAPGGLWGSFMTPADESRSWPPSVSATPLTQQPCAPRPGSEHVISGGGVGAALGA